MGCWRKITLELELSRELDAIERALLAVLDGTALPHVLDPGINLRHRAPDQVRVRDHELVVLRGERCRIEHTPRRGETRGRIVDLLISSLNCGSQRIRPPMLVAGL